MPASPLDRLRKLALALPEAHEVESWGTATFRVNNKLFAMYSGLSNHKGGDRVSVWCKAAPGNQEIMVQLAPQRFFSPPYVGSSGWVGVWIDKGVDWPEVGRLLRDGWELAAARAKKKTTIPKKKPAPTRKKRKPAGRPRSRK